MGILGDLKKIFFVAESLGKSAAGKGKDLAKETTEVSWSAPVILVTPLSQRHPQ